MLYGNMDIILRYEQHSDSPYGSSLVHKIAQNSQQLTGLTLSISTGITEGNHNQTPTLQLSKVNVPYCVSRFSLTFGYT